MAELDSLMLSRDMREGVLAVARQLSAGQSGNLLFLCL